MQRLTTAWDAEFPSFTAEAFPLNNRIETGFVGTLASIQQ
jgi:hypothetical protein